MSCDLCGASGKTVLAKVEGVAYRVCSNCQKYGQTVREVRKRPRSEKRNDTRVVRADYAQVLRNAREKSGMTQDDFADKLGVKRSQWHAMEQGHRAPTLSDAESLEKQLHIRLLEQQAESIASHGYKSSGGSGLTLGDLMKK